jgi:polar amino acid transport system substrate-binding protein
MTSSDNERPARALVRSLLSRFSAFLILLTTLVFSGHSAFAAPTNTVLRCGWYPFDPYQYEIETRDSRRLTGLDVALIRAIFQQAGYDVSYSPVSWKQHQLDLREGIRDVAGGAFWTQERAEYCYYSEPYRKESDVIYVRRGDAAKYRAGDVDELFEKLAQNKFRVGVVNGFFYGPKMMKFLQEPENAARVVTVENDARNFENLIQGKIDGFPVDHLSGATLCWRNGWNRQVFQLRVPIYTENIHVIFSKKTTSPELVAAFNQSLHEVKSNGRYPEIVREYLFPALLGATVGQRWFLVICILGVIAFSLSGVLLARQGEYSIYGAFILSALPAVGGGVIRDLLVGRERSAILAEPLYMITILATVTAGYLWFRVPWHRNSSNSPRPPASRVGGWFTMNRAIQLFDAAGLAAFTIVGVIVAVESRCHPLWLWGPILAAVTGSGGGIVRDALRGDGKISAMKGTFYAEIAAIWGLFLALFLTWYAQRFEYDPGDISLAVTVVLFGAFFTRIAAEHFHLKSPMY